MDEVERRVFGKLSSGNRTLDEVANNRMYYGVKTGYNKAFVIDQMTRDHIVREDPTSMEVIKPLLQGQDLRPWYQENAGRWLIAIPSGWTRLTLGDDLSEEQAWEALRDRHSLIAEHLQTFSDTASKRYDQGEYWWELRPCAYYDEFEMPKILWPDITKIPRFSYDTIGYYLGNTGYILPSDKPWLLGFLSSRCAWYLISHISVALGERAGMNRYRLIDQYMRPFPIPELSLENEDVIGTLAMTITSHARDRYQLHRSVRHRIQSDLGTPDKKLNQKLTAWWELDFAVFRSEIKKVFKREIPVAERDEWEDWLAAQQAEHNRLTSEIIRLETELNAHVYRLFDLTPDEIQIIEESTKYHYGEV